MVVFLFKVTQLYKRMRIHAFSKKCCRLHPQPKDAIGTTDKVLATQGTML